ncbi:MAG: hydrogenase maturation nickel metallochaperone HypA [Zetaproteobacteria bacterium CG06_land_8_20_14_3_00_59_53]|nr:MAG: hydrogenase maturation nickel metallochaperone HypA [Zetaproteobacteria bacterium CG2_30_59_37]PIO90563.1 MAG: hydrogenase maturation nickel metallochaperone HypA [Zetaproteobacteria bacterium CG23_combo_of_CG06-09_8_20_14_all_59_86]PIQ66169.1 MAG: hydrogenase maturation nickel metallochaperone HypA [Zetaproteobacteria bacterium CG11_big_fil_rev_8_21_14_0_20_59_439]PIU71511.1 MAG: hydrogenase maturation nickel metallochaperone HypA [Zetaproteobacteria bacterium CG06_land_8_20_14_3_00_59_
MHEMSLCEGVVQLIEDQTRKQGFTKVSTVWLEIGALAGVEIEAMRFSFDAVAKDTVADGARLEIIEIAGRARCPACKQTVQVTARYDACPECGHYPLEILAGEEMRISELEVQ